MSHVITMRWKRLAWAGGLMDIHNSIDVFLAATEHLDVHWLQDRHCAYSNFFIQFVSSNEADIVLIKLQFPDVQITTLAEWGLCQSNYWVNH